MKKSFILAIALLSATAPQLSAPSAWAAQDNRHTVRTATGSIVMDARGNCVRTRWRSEGDDCAPPAPVVLKEEPIPQRRSIDQEERTVYFDFNKATLSAEAMRKLDSLAGVLKSQEDVREAHIAGFADRMGSASYNEKLSRKRAEAVKHYIVSRGYSKASVAKTRWLGETSPVTECPGKLPHSQLIQCLQKDRRVEVELDYLPQENGDAVRR